MFVNRNRCRSCGGSSIGGGMSGNRRWSSGISLASSGALALTACRNTAAGINRDASSSTSINGMSAGVPSCS